MTKQESEQLSNVLKAYSEGQTIQAKGKRFYTSNEWHDIAVLRDLELNTLDFEYRIKPEPKLRPYKNAEEFLKAQKEHGMYLQNPKDERQYILPLFIGISSVSFQDKSQPSYEELLIGYTWQDGTPCGISE